MFIAIARPAVEPSGVIPKSVPRFSDEITPYSTSSMSGEPLMGGPDAVAVPGSPAIPALPPRALHARLLQNAALRRMRGLERLRSRRLDDASYWLHAAPAAVRKASLLRAQTGFARLP